MTTCKTVSSFVKPGDSLRFLKYWNQWFLWFWFLPKKPGTGGSLVLKYKQKLEPVGIKNHIPMQHWSIVGFAVFDVICGFLKCAGHAWTSDYGCADNKEEFEWLIKWAQLVLLWWCTPYESHRLYMKIITHTTNEPMGPRCSTIKTLCSIIQNYKTSLHTIWFLSEKLRLSTWLS